MYYGSNGFFDYLLETEGGSKVEKLGIQYDVDHIVYEAGGEWIKKLALHNWPYTPVRWMWDSSSNVEK